MTGLVEDLKLQFEVSDVFSDIPNAKFYILAKAEIEVTEQMIKDSCDMFNYEFKSMKKLDRPFADVRKEIEG